MRGLLFSQMEPPPELETEFHDWYDTEHIPVRLRLPGFGSAVRYEAVGPSTRFLVCYFIDDLAVLESEPYAQLKSRPGDRTERMLAAVHGFTRYTCELVGDTGAVPPSSLTWVHAFRAADPDRADDEYMAAMRASDTSRWRRSQLYRPFGRSVGTPWTHLAIHEIDLGDDDGDDGGDAHPEPPDGLASIELDEHVWWSYRAFGRFGAASP